jgi:NADH:ubiquinone oxidoreductase subunit 6 (subunit J)
MWQIMWMLGFVPTVVWHFLLIISTLTLAATYFLRIIPFVRTHAIVLRLTAVAVLLLTVWMLGGISNEAKWQARVQELEARVAAAEKAAAEANSQIETVYVDRIKVVKEIQYVVQKDIADSASVLDANCRIIPEAVDILNQAAGVKK